MNKYSFHIEGPFCNSGEAPIPVIPKQDYAAEKAAWTPNYLENLNARRAKTKAGGGQKRIDAQHKNRQTHSA